MEEEVNCQLEEVVLPIIFGSACLLKTLIIEMKMHVCTNEFGPEASIKRFREIIFGFRRADTRHIGITACLRCKIIYLIVLIEATGRTTSLTHETDAFLFIVTKTSTRAYYTLSWLMSG